MCPSKSASVSEDSSRHSLILPPSPSTSSFVPRPPLPSMPHRQLRLGHIVQPLISVLQPAVGLAPAEDSDRRARLMAPPEGEIAPGEGLVFHLYGETGLTTARAGGRSLSTLASLRLPGSPPSSSVSSHPGCFDGLQAAPSPSSTSGHTPACPWPPALPLQCTRTMCPRPRRPRTRPPARWRTPPGPPLGLFLCMQ